MIMKNSHFDGLEGETFLEKVRFLDGPDEI